MKRITATPARTVTSPPSVAPPATNSGGKIDTEQERQTYVTKLQGMKT
jgi:hypothetical protein